MSKKGKSLVLITNQSFREAGGRSEFPNLDMIGLVNVEIELRESSGMYSYDGESEPEQKFDIDEANELLTARVRGVGGTHLFRVQYVTNSTGQVQIAYGTAYGPRK